MITIDTIEEQIKNTVKKFNGLKDRGFKIDTRLNGIIINMFVRLSSDQYLPDKI